ncbi:site-specific DNA-methyltransferase [Lacrimispora sp.]|uniref:site-specific DNA-methyltransferase n=1 Tax=Lacrimispora sp. TaxID=2719234 RepID=UPI0028AF7852|nr:site-specific DNA-methyltransferase [Lacrimispora sp.]
MDKLTMHTVSKAERNYAALVAMFPNAVTETIDENGEVVRAIDKDVLMQEISTRVVEGNEERYQFTWPDKKKSVLLANAPIAKTLRPCREESVDFDATENLYIEGDNLEVLKLLQETYLGKVKMIYIDPPYNTGNDFVYEDNFSQSTEEYLENSGQFDDDGNRLVKNLDSNGRFHTDWLNMIYPRLKLAKDLLTDDGVIFISIDDNEVAQLRKICDEIFGESNFVASFMWKRKKEISSDSKNVAVQGENIFCFSKSIEAHLLLEAVSQAYIDKSYKAPTDEFPQGKWRPVPLTVSKGLSGGGYTYTVTTPTGVQHTRLWAYPQISYERLVKENRVYFGKDNSGIPQRVMYAHESKGQPITNYWDNVATNKEGKKEILTLFSDSIFDTPKPTALIKKMMNVSTVNDDVILDFFSGSSTTAHAVMQLNAEDGGSRKFIMVQLPEEVDEKSEAYKAGYQNICEIGKERIRRAGKKIVEENKDKDGIENLDIGFRVLKCDSSNMKDVYYNPADYEADLFSSLTDNIKEDRTPEDLLFQVMLDLGVLLSSKIEESTIAGKTIFNVADGFLMACFDETVTEETITAIAQKKPYYFVMRDSSMANDSVATNFEQIFATYSPDTVRKVL